MKDPISEVFGISRWYSHLDVCEIINEDTPKYDFLPVPRPIKEEGVDTLGLFITSDAQPKIEAFLRAICGQYRWIVYECLPQSHFEPTAFKSFLQSQALDYVILDTTIKLHSLLKQCNQDFLAMDCSRMNQANYKKQVLQNAYTVPNFIA